MKSMPEIVGGKIIAGDSTNVQVTLLKKLPDLERKIELPIEYPNQNEKMPNYPGYVPHYSDYSSIIYPELGKIPDDDNIEVGPY